MRILAVDPGLTRCGVGVVDLNGRDLSLVEAQVLRTDPPLSAAWALVAGGKPRPENRLGIMGGLLEEQLERLKPQVIAVEKVFAQENRRSITDIAGLIGIVNFLAHRRGLSVSSHTPSEVKAAICGFGDAGKQQVKAMVLRTFKLQSIPGPADVTDALALAVCCARRGLHRLPGNLSTGALTPAQMAWQAAL